MKTSEYRTRFCFRRQITMAGIIACLCLSAGEGLRLRPFPVFGIEEAGATSAQLHAGALNEVSTRYIPLVVTTWPMKRGKQQVVEYENPPCQIRRESTFDPLLLPVTREAMEIVSIRVISRIPCRAPPFAS